MDKDTTQVDLEHGAIPPLIQSSYSSSLQITPTDVSHLYFYYSSLTICHGEAL